MTRFFACFLCRSRRSRLTYVRFNLFVCFFASFFSRFMLGQVIAQAATKVKPGPVAALLPGKNKHTCHCVIQQCTDLPNFEAYPMCPCTTNSMQRYVCRHPMSTGAGLMKYPVVYQSLAIPGGLTVDPVISCMAFPSMRRFDQTGS